MVTVEWGITGPVTTQTNLTDDRGIATFTVPPDAVVTVDVVKDPYYFPQHHVVTVAKVGGHLKVFLDRKPVQLVVYVLHEVPGWAGAKKQVPLEGAEVKTGWENVTAMAYTRANGIASMEVPPFMPLDIEVSKQGYDAVKIAQTRQRSLTVVLKQSSTSSYPSPGFGVIALKIHVRNHKGRPISGAAVKAVTKKGSA